MIKHQINRFFTKYLFGYIKEYNMSTLEFKLYDLLKTKLGTQEAQSVVEFVRLEVKDAVEDKTLVLATKEDVHKLDLKISETKNDIIKWLFGFWITIIMVILANWLIKK